jgi:NDP-4-keto-2,6-dideoxyhexose 3-C-methyltransferase
VGIDPADDSFKKEAEKVSDLIIQDYFSAEVYRNGLEHYKKAKVVTSIAVFYDIEDREGFLADVYDVMDDNGLWVLQQSYTPLMLQQVAFDNLCHEHYYYYSLFNIKKLLERNGFKIMDCQINDINGGSFRLYVMKDAGDEKLFASQPHRDVCNYRIESVLCYEKTLCLDYKSTWCVFFDKINDLKERVTDFIRNEKQHGKTIAGYGASTKGNTLLQYFELDNTVIDFIADRSPYKWGRKTIGTNIPIISEKIMRIVHPDYLLILPWHFITEFTKRESEYLQKGGHFIVPCPKLQII